MGSTWAVDLADVGAVYPWIGWEVTMVIVAVAVWILWHILQIRQEDSGYDEDVKLYGKPEALKKALDQYPA